MPVLTGVLLDLSKVIHPSLWTTLRYFPWMDITSWIHALGIGDGAWAESFYKVVDDLIKKDVTESNHVFALGVGASSSSQPEVFDLLNTLKNGRTDIRCSVSNDTVMNVPDAREILHVGEMHPPDVDLDELFTPFVLAAKPLKSAFEQAAKLFALHEYEDHQKLLFVLSDGEVNDETKNCTVFSRHDVTVVSCFISDHSKCHPLELYSSEVPEWGEPTKFMFRLSSAVKTALIPQSIYSKRGWKIDKTNDETKVFFLVNHPNLIQGVCEIARDVLSHQDALAHVPKSDCLNHYLNDTTGFVIPKQQKKGTCYANAIALVLNLAMKRITNRVGGQPTFLQIRAKLIEKYGWDGANIHTVLREMCPQYRLHYQEVDAVGARKAVAAKRPVIARFYLTDDEWTSFGNFYEGNKGGILTRSEIDISRRPPGAPISGHAVVLTSCDCDSLRFMNSWGFTWGDEGYFKVENADVLNVQFTDVFWTLDDLEPQEKREYVRRGLELIKKLRVDTRVQVQGTKYLCPLCLEKPEVRDFTDRFLLMECQSCGDFKNIW